MLSKLLDEALAVTPAARQGWLATLAARDVRGANELRLLMKRLSAGSSRQLLQAPLARVDASRPGRRIAPVRLRHGLELRGTGEVWCAEHLGATRAEPVTLKLPRGDRAAAPESLRREARMQRRLHHPGIVPLQHAGEHQGRPWLAMPLKGRQAIDVWGLQRGLAAHFAVVAQLASTLAWLHRRGIVHRDVKPVNVLVDADCRARLIDFGIAASSGTPGADAPPVAAQSRALGYSAPEQAVGTAPAPTADLCGLGPLLCEALVDPTQVRQAHREWQAHLAKPVADFLAQRLLSQMPPGVHRRMAEAALQPCAHHHLASAAASARGIGANS